MFPQTVVKALSEHDYEIVKYLNKGGFGTCYIVKSLKYEIQFVCKVSNDTTGDFIREQKALTSFDHPNIVRVYDAFTYEKYLFLILEYCSGGSLLSLINSHKKISVSQMLKYSRDIIQALDYMHGLGFAHCDIKPSNVLIDEFGRAKLCDFGLTIFTNQGKKQNNRICGSVNYMAPEMALNREYDPIKCDIWSLGVTLYHFATGKVPYNGNHLKYISAELKFDREDFKHVPEQMAFIIEKCLRLNQDERYTSRQLLKCIDQIPQLSSQSRSKSVSRPFTSAASHIIRPHPRVRGLTKSMIA
ncbi:AGC family protein kinase [Trichomonas vaginalis G3]|uniref:AGC family protein kinase n=1 Tax=Trichomonas vaginalis (strain ATCC PRA-98 / G3) TaxID=412133 RepID=A2G9K4_TRIV3|nr:peptidyl-serine phosphorylation [Trichomonas vaginalis G3]EAX86163.1 AGC family protein kinase [Trichomonas vaginalis G3]KAI5511686.1 peptidyl-serine phosphorylation [Trichomonas vaginalis G3]|eukprot:XP_001299093.1 AGC family protein kinase [Trichomonas vaginalis G3]